MLSVYAFQTRDNIISVSIDNYLIGEKHNLFIKLIWNLTGGGPPMKIRVVSSREEISELNPNEKMIHLAFRPSNKDIFNLVQTCAKVEVIQIPSSYRRTVSKSIEMFLQMQNIKLVEGDVWGHRKDINEYFSISPAIMDKIKEMKAEGRSDSDIADKIEREGKLNREMIFYILKKQK